MINSISESGILGRYKLYKLSIVKRILSIPPILLSYLNCQNVSFVKRKSHSYAHLHFKKSQNKSISFIISLISKYVQ